MLMTIQQIKKIFEDMGIGTEDERRYFTDFAITQAPEPRLFDFIRLDDVSTSETKWVCCPFCGAEVGGYFQNGKSHWKDFPADSLEEFGKKYAHLWVDEVKFDV